MNSKMIVEKYDAKLPGQQILWEDDELILRNTKFKPTGDNDFDRQAIAYWYMNVNVPNGQGDENTPYEIYKTWSDANYSYFRYCRSSGAYSYATGQVIPNLSCYKGKSLKSHLADLNIWLPYIKPYNNSDVGKLGKSVKIFERTLSKDGIYELWVFSESEVELSRTRYGIYSTISKFNSLSEAVKYIIENHYYEKVRRRKHE